MLWQAAPMHHASRFPSSEQDDQRGGSKAHPFPSTPSCTLGSLTFFQPGASDKWDEAEKGEEGGEGGAVGPGPPSHPTHLHLGSDQHARLKPLAQRPRTCSTSGAPIFWAMSRRTRSAKSVGSSFSCGGHRDTE